MTRVLTLTQDVWKVEPTDSVSNVCWEVILRLQNQAKSDGFVLEIEGNSDTGNQLVTCRRGPAQKLSDD